MLASKANQKIFHKDCVPEGFVLSDPDHLTNFKIIELYTHWLARQQRKIPPFVVLKPGPNHQAAGLKSQKARGKQKIPYVDVDSDDPEVRPSGDEEEEDPSGDKVGEDLFSRPMKFGPPGRQVAGSSRLAWQQEDGVLAAGSSAITPPAKKGKRTVAPTKTKKDSAKTQAKSKPKKDEEAGMVGIHSQSSLQSSPGTN